MDQIQPTVAFDGQKKGILCGKLCLTSLLAIYWANKGYCFISPTLILMCFLDHHRYSSTTTLLHVDEHHSSEISITASWAEGNDRSLLPKLLINVFSSRSEGQCSVHRCDVTFPNPKDTSCRDTKDDFCLPSSLDASVFTEEGRPRDFILFLLAMDKLQSPFLV
ncbi:hypothetical protein Y1Q_0014811 [Alligator mississippiensis]|uniref:Uncharacterized protein n=1 Tax=Alligator mississippiensis TaxID=8496 RepID=A0A151M238_ALLMI|nr:hypothetical protein Y1Q_0014811 [Alligator mississippiensis]